MSFSPLDQIGRLPGAERQAQGDSRSVSSRTGTFRFQEHLRDPHPPAPSADHANRARPAKDSPSAKASRSAKGTDAPRDQPSTRPEDAPAAGESQEAGSPSATSDADATTEPAKDTHPELPADKRDPDRSGEPQNQDQAEPAPVAAIPAGSDLVDELPAPSEEGEPVEPPKRPDVPVDTQPTELPADLPDGSQPDAMPSSEPSSSDPSSPGDGSPTAGFPSPDDSMPVTASTTVAEGDASPMPASHPDTAHDRRPDRRRAENTGATAKDMMGTPAATPTGGESQLGPIAAPTGLGAGKPTDLAKQEKPTGELSGREAAEPKPAASAASQPTHDSRAVPLPARPLMDMIGKGAAPTTDQPALSGPDQARFLQRVVRAAQVANHRGGPIRLRLSPPELGSLRLEIRAHAGTLTVRVEAEAEVARSVLLSNETSLRERLADQGIRVDQFDVGLMDRQTGSSPDFPFDQQPAPAAPSNGRTSSASADDSQENANPVQPRVPHGDEQLDIVI